MRNTNELALDTYAHVRPDDDDGARQIMNAFLRAAESACSAQPKAVSMIMCCLPYTTVSSQDHDRRIRVGFSVPCAENPTRSRDLA
jgi:hypothetical protein